MEALRILAEAVRVLMKSNRALQQALKTWLGERLYSSGGETACRDPESAYRGHVIDCGGLDSANRGLEIVVEAL
jgi:hypothetical protein